jgi:hypothetical protein
LISLPTSFTSGDSGVTAKEDRRRNEVKSATGAGGIGVAASQGD